jgi:hypothetical protein
MIVLKPAGGDLFALSVDVVHDHEELVVKPAAPLVMATGLYAGTTLADDGSPILLLDPSGIASSAGVLLDQEGLDKIGAGVPATEEVRKETPALLFRTFDGTKRVIDLAVVERIEDVAAEAVKRSAGQLRVTLGDRILPLYGCEAVPSGRLRVLRLTDGAAEIGYGFQDVIDLVSLGESIEPAATQGEVRGVTLIAGEQVEVIDTFWLFGSGGAEVETGGTQPVCAIPAGNPWMENILRPIVESAGYRVVAEGEVAKPGHPHCHGRRAGRVLRARRIADPLDDRSRWTERRQHLPLRSRGLALRPQPPSAGKHERLIDDPASLIARVAGERIAIDAAEIESVVELEATTPIPRSAPHVAGLAALRSRVVTVIDCLAALELGHSPASYPRDAIVVEVEGHPYALLVDAVRDVLDTFWRTAAPSAPGPLRAGTGCRGGMVWPTTISSC